MNVLLIEDDIQLNTTITNYLMFNNYDVTSLEDGEKALSLIDYNDYSLFIIDINIPNIDGLELIRYIRQKDLTTPIIIISASMELKNFKTAFENGCSEYIKKPFYLEELEIRINNLLEKNNVDNIVTISEDITYDLEYEELLIGDDVIKLRKKERRLLTLLLLNINKTVRTEHIEDYVWENEIKESYPLRQLVNCLRSQFPKEENYITVDKGIGYRFEIKE